jgi:hypothetical protein
MAKAKKDATSTDEVVEEDEADHLLYEDQLTQVACIARLVSVRSTAQLLQKTNTVLLQVASQVKSTAPLDYATWGTSCEQAHWLVLLAGHYVTDSGDDDEEEEETIPASMMGCSAASAAAGGGGGGASGAGGGGDLLVTLANTMVQSLRLLAGDHACCFFGPCSCGRLRLAAFEMIFAVSCILPWDVRNEACRGMFELTLTVGCSN